MKINYQKLKMPLLSPFTTIFGTGVNKDVYVFKLEHDGIVAYSEVQIGLDSVFILDSDIINRGSTLV